MAIDLKDIKEINDLAYILEQASKKTSGDTTFLIMAMILKMQEKLEQVGNIKEGLNHLTMILDEIRHDLYRQSRSGPRPPYLDRRTIQEEESIMREELKKLHKREQEQSKIVYNWGIDSGAKIKRDS